MPRNSIARILLILMAFCASVCAVAECSNKITLVPLTVWKSPKQSRDFVRFSYSLTATDSLLAHDDPERSVGSYDTGFAITRNQGILRKVTLQNLPELRGDSLFAENSNTLAITRARTSGVPVYFVTLGYEGDMTSPDLFLAVIPNADGYEISALPKVSGGVLDVSRSDPLHLRTWDNLSEGECNACATRYRVTEFQVQDGKPVRIRRFRTRHLYSSDEAMFDDRRRVRFIP